MGSKMYEWEKYARGEPFGLLASWEEFCKRIGASVNSSTIYNNVLHLAYSEPHRAYHTLSHIDSALNEFKEFRGSLEKYKRLPSQLHLNEIEMALWFHDAVYDTGRSNNEERSAKLAFEYSLEMGMPQSFAIKSQELVLATKHDKLPEDYDSKIISDIDLSILGKPEKEYGEYEEGIRNEYWKVPDGIYICERVKILKALLDRPRIYSTNFFNSKYETQASKNLKRTIVRLGGKI